MKQSRPNYVLKLADGTERVFTPNPHHLHLWDNPYISPSLTSMTLQALGATPVPQEEPKVVYRLTFADEGCEWRTRSDLITFKSHEDAENYRRRCESIGPEWTDWEPKEGQECYWVQNRLSRCFLWSGIESDYLALYSGLAHPTKERAIEWLDRFGKAWGLM